jgi:uncharacterized membrane protein
VSKFVLVTFPDEAKAHQGTSAVRDLQAKGSTKLYASALIARDSGGKLSVREITNEGRGGAAAGALIGGLAGLSAGPLAAILGAAGGAIIGISADLTNQHAETAFAEKMSPDLAPDRIAIVVELADEGVVPFQTLMEAIGGSVTIEQ